MEGEYASRHPSISWILIVYCVAVSEQYVVELSGLPYFRGNFVQPCSFPIFNFSENRVEFFLWWVIKEKKENKGNTQECNVQF